MKEAINKELQRVNIFLEQFNELETEYVQTKDKYNKSSKLLEEYKERLNSSILINK